MEFNLKIAVEQTSFLFLSRKERKEHKERMFLLIIIAVLSVRIENVKCRIVQIRSDRFCTVCCALFGRGDFGIIWLVRQCWQLIDIGWETLSQPPGREEWRMEN